MTTATLGLSHQDSRAEEPHPRVPTPPCPHLGLGPGHGVQEDKQGHQGPGQDAVLDLPEAQQEGDAERQQVQPCEETAEGRPCPGSPLCLSPRHPAASRAASGPHRAVVGAALRASGQQPWTTASTGLRRRQAPQSLPSRGLGEGSRRLSRGRQGARKRRVQGHKPRTCRSPSEGQAHPRVPQHL